MNWLRHKWAQLRMRLRKEPTPFLSLAMMVKNEEDHIRTALESMAPWVDEIVIVDTGSTDRTVEICREFTDKVYIHPWERNFSKHRNQSLSYCTGEWIIYIDGDEKLDEKSGPQLKDTIRKEQRKHPHIDSMMLHLINWTKTGQNMGSCNLVRCFKNDPKIKFQNRVHNDLTGFHATVISPLVIHHYGYDLSDMARRMKYIRTTRLLKEWIADEPYNPVPCHYMAISSHTLNDMPEVLYWAKRCLELQEHPKGKQCGPQLRSWGYYMIITAYLQHQDFATALEWADKGFEEFPDHLDGHALASNAAFLTRDWERCVKHADEYVKVHDRAALHPQSMQLQAMNLQRSRWKVEHQAAIARMELNHRLDDIFQGFARSVATAPDQTEAIKAIGEVFNRVTPC